MSDLNVARLVPHNEQDALLAAACPLPDMFAGVGHVFHRGEYWLLIYESCGHDQYFRRTADGLYDLADVQAEIRHRRHSEAARHHDTDIYRWHDEQLPGGHTARRVLP